MKLYDIDRKILDALENAQCDENGEFSSEALDAIYEERTTKLENIGLFIKELDYTARALKAEEQALQERRSAVEKKIEWLKEYAAASVATFGMVETSRIKMTIRQSESVNILDETKLPQDLVVTKTTVLPDKTEIKRRIKSGEVIDGAELKINNNLQIK